LGGWHGPIPVGSILGLTFENGFWWGFAGNVLGTLNILFKGVVGVTVMMWVRWTLPRLRIDQVITTCLKYCVPIAAVGFLGATLWQYQWPHRQFFGLMRLPRESYEVRELAPPPRELASEDRVAAVTIQMVPLGSRHLPME
jgi:hypothetical protein